MQLEHSFTVPIGVETAWQLLADVGSTAPYLPGSTITEAAPDHAEGSLKVKLGPLNLTYQGSSRLVEADADARRAVLQIAGEDARNGSASATVTLALEPDGDATTVTVTTDLEVTGKPAKFGRGVMADVGAKVIAQFSANLAAALANGTLPGGAPAPEHGEQTADAVASTSKPRPRPRKATPEPESPPAAEAAAVPDTVPNAVPDAEPEAATAQPLGTDALDVVDSDDDPIEIAETAAAEDTPDRSADTAEIAADVDADDPGADDPGADDPGADDPGADDPGADDPVAPTEPGEPGTAPPVSPTIFAVPDVGTPSTEPLRPRANGHDGALAATPAPGLIESARPIVAKGLAPVALAIVLVLGRARRRRRS